MNKKLKKSEKFALVYASALQGKILGAFIAEDKPMKGLKLKESTKTSISEWMNHKFDEVWQDVMQEVNCAVNPTKEVPQKKEKSKLKKVSKKKPELVNLSNTDSWSEEPKEEKKTKKASKKTSKKTK